MARPVYTEFFCNLLFRIYQDQAEREKSLSTDHLLEATTLLCPPTRSALFKWYSRTHPRTIAVAIGKLEETTVKLKQFALDYEVTPCCNPPPLTGDRDAYPLHQHHQGV